MDKAEVGLIHLRTVGPQRVDSEIELRPVSDRDTLELFHLIDAHRAYLKCWLPWLDDARDVTDVQAFIQASTAMQEADSGLQFGVWYRHVLAGLAGFNRIDSANRQADMGYWLGETFQGRGIMRRTCRALMTLAYTRLDVHRLQIVCAPGNARSRALPEHLGFARDGVLRDAEWLYDHFEDSIVYSRLSTD